MRLSDGVVKPPSGGSSTTTTLLDGWGINARGQQGAGETGAGRPGGSNVGAQGGTAGGSVGIRSGAAGIPRPSAGGAPASYAPRSGYGFGGARGSSARASGPRLVGSTQQRPLQPVGGVERSSDYASSDESYGFVRSNNSYSRVPQPAVSDSDYHNFGVQQTFMPGEGAGAGRVEADSRYSSRVGDSGSVKRVSGRRHARVSERKSKRGKAILIVSAVMVVVLLVVALVCLAMSGLGGSDTQEGAGQPVDSSEVEGSKGDGQSGIDAGDPGLDNAVEVSKPVSVSDLDTGVTVSTSEYILSYETEMGPVALVNIKVVGGSIDVSTLSLRYGETEYASTSTRDEELKSRSVPVFDGTSGWVAFSVSGTVTDSGDTPLSVVYSRQGIDGAQPFTGEMPLR